MPHTHYCKHRKPVPGRGSAYEECLDCGRQGPISELVSTPCLCRGRARARVKLREQLVDDVVVGVERLSKALGLPVELIDTSTPSDPSSPLAVALNGPEEPANPFGEG